MFSLIILQYLYMIELLVYRNFKRKKKHFQNSRTCFIEYYYEVHYLKQKRQHIATKPHSLICIKHLLNLYKNSTHVSFDENYEHSGTIIRIKHTFRSM